MPLRLLSLLLLLVSSSHASDNWPQFRGENGAGASTNQEIPLEWSADKNHAWSTEIGGSGWSSPIVCNGVIYLTTTIPDKPEATAPRGMVAESRSYPIPDIVYDWRVLALSLADGKILWNKSLHVGKANQGKHNKNSYATETPTTDGKRLYVYFSQLGLFAFDFAGSLLWKQDPGQYPTYLDYGTSSSPITDGQRVYLQCDNEQTSFVVAYDAATGKELWRQNRQDTTSWSTPFLWKNSVRTELVTVAPKKTRSYDPATGQLLWELAGMSDYAVPIPIADDNYCYISTGFLVNPRNRPIFAVKPGAEGDITLTEPANSNAFVAWRNKLGSPYVPSPLLHQGKLYIVHDRPLFDVLDTRTGQPVYPRKRLPQGGNFTASPLTYRDKILCLTEEGLAYLLDTGAEFNVHAVNPPLDEDGLYLATPALAENALLIRGAKKLHCIRQEP